MEIVHAHQVSFDELLNEQVDIIIAACGYETRSSHLVQLAHFNAKRKIALLFKELPDFASRKKNEEIFLSKDYECYEIESNSAENINKVLHAVCKDFNDENVKILIDYSSMTRIWYGNIIQFLTNIECNIRHLVIYFSYTPENYFPVTSSIEKGNKPYSVFLNQNQINTNKPIALVLGLGYDVNSAEYLNNFFNNPDKYLFVPNPSFNDKYTLLAKENNSGLINSSNPINVFQYSAANIEDIESKLRSVCLNLRLKYRVIIASLGPKTFSLASFLVNTRYPDVEIWHVNDNENAYDIKPSGLPIVYKAILTDEEF